MDGFSTEADDADQRREADEELGLPKKVGGRDDRQRTTDAGGPECEEGY
jgi:hypothetical protein